jgi:hypothetical protein
MWMRSNRHLVQVFEILTHNMQAKGSWLTVDEPHEWTYKPLNTVWERRLKVRSQVNDVTRNLSDLLEDENQAEAIVTTDHQAPRLLYGIHTDLVPLPIRNTIKYLPWFTIYRRIVAMIENSHDIFERELTNGSGSFGVALGEK